MQKGFPVTPAMVAAHEASTLRHPCVTLVEQPITRVEETTRKRRASSPLPFLALAALALSGGAWLIYSSSHAHKAAHVVARVPLTAPARVAATPAPAPTPRQITRPGSVPIVQPEKPFNYEYVPSVPEAYSGDPAGQALWEKTVEEDQQTLQPEDLEEGPPRKLPDMRGYPDTAALNLDADGNVN